MRRHAWVVWLACALLLVEAAIYLRDPPWIGEVTSGMGRWETDKQGTPFRWTSGRGSFFIRSDATAMTLPLRVGPPGDHPPISVEVRVDDRWLATLQIPDFRHGDPNAWVRHTLALPADAPSRRYRRIDLRVSRWQEHSLGVQLGDVELQRIVSTR